MNDFFVGGFIRKCAEYGIGPYEAGTLLKFAQAPAVTTTPVPGPNKQTVPAAPSAPTAPSAAPASTGAQQPSAASSVAVQHGTGTAWQPPQGLSQHQTGQYNKWSGMSAEQQYQLLQRATPQQRRLLRQWTSPERQAELRNLHRQNRQRRELESYDAAVGQTARHGTIGQSGSQVENELRTVNGADPNYRMSAQAKNNFNRAHVAPIEDAQYSQYNAAQGKDTVAYRTLSGAVVMMPRSQYNTMTANRNAGAAQDLRNAELRSTIRNPTRVGFTGPPRNFRPTYVGRT